MKKSLWLAAAMLVMGTTAVAQDIKSKTEATFAEKQKPVIQQVMMTPDASYGLMLDNKQNASAVASVDNKFGNFYILVKNSGKETDARIKLSRKINENVDLSYAFTDNGAYQLEASLKKGALKTVLAKRRVDETSKIHGYTSLQFEKFVSTLGYKLDRDNKDLFTILAIPAAFLRATYSRDAASGMQSGLIDLKVADGNQYIGCSKFLSGLFSATERYQFLGPSDFTNTPPTISDQTKHVGGYLFAKWDSDKGLYLGKIATVAQVMDGLKVGPSVTVAKDQSPSYGIEAQLAKKGYVLNASADIVGENKTGWLRLQKSF